MKQHFDVLVIGSGPAGQKAAIQAAKGGLKVMICEQLKEIGGACVQFGTIPSKALRERAVVQHAALCHLSELKLDTKLPDPGVKKLIGEMTSVVKAHDGYMSEQLIRNGVEIRHGRVRFLSNREVAVSDVSGQEEQLSANYFVIACGSRPRQPDNVPIDHEHVFDSDSILSLAYLPESLAVLGGGVIACEYASIFALLGVEVTLIDRYPRLLGFLDGDLSEGFLRAFERAGGTFIGESTVDSVSFDKVSKVITRLADGITVETQKVLCALGRVAALDGLGIDNTDVVVNDGLVSVNASGQTQVPHIYAAGDVVGPPSLASASMEQGRRVACQILGIDPGRQGEWIPTGIYGVPELASVGLTEVAARGQDPDVVVGISRFAEIARGHIADTRDGMLKLVVGSDRRVKGIHIMGAQATDLIHVGQLGLIHDATIDIYIENVFNFPTYAESYRVAALDAARRLEAHARSGSASRVA